MNEHTFQSKTPVTNVSVAERLVSAAAGILLSSYAFKKSKPVSAAAIAAGGFLLYRSITGNCPVYTAVGKHKQPRPLKNINIRTAVIINRPIDVVYDEWRSMLILKERTNQYISWRSLPGSHIESAGKVEFKELQPGTTQVETTVSYRSVAGLLGQLVLKAVNPLFRLIVKGEIRGFKKYLESDDKVMLNG